MTRLNVCLRFLSLAVLAGPALGAQAPSPQPRVVTVPESQVLQFRIAGSPPDYPLLARAAKVEAVIRLEVRITPTGTVESVKVLHGHPMLDQAAIEAVERWRFSPMTIGGQAVTVVTTFSIPFLLNAGSVRMEDVTAAQDAVLSCARDTRDGKFTDAIVGCEAARKAALPLSRSLGVGMRVEAELLLAKSLAALGRSVDAIPVFESALGAVPRPGMGFSEARVEALRGLTDAYASLGRIGDAVKSCDRAENELEGGISAYKSVRSTQVASLNVDLRAVTLKCAELLDKAGKPNDAEKARQRAAKIK